MDVPGMKIEDIELTLEKGHLCIRGERKAVSCERTRLHEERVHGQFQRMIALSNTVDPSAVEATLREGVLYITLTKRRECQPHRIEVKPGDAGQARIAAS
jgi:HSP20 family protein